jgi:hypothetical protein
MTASHIVPFTAVSQTIGRLLASANVDPLGVPLYQREYAWSADEVEKMLRDLDRAQRTNPSAPDYFLGSIVMSSGKPIEVIDGQQRLATTVIIFAGIRDALHSRECIDQAQWVQSDFLVRRPSLDETGRGVQPRLTLNRHDKGHFWNEIILYPRDAGWQSQQPMRDSHDAINSAKQVVRDWFDRELNKAVSKSDVISMCKRWTDQLIDHVIVAAITAANRKEAFRMFATLNDRGIRVGQADLVKSFLFEMAATSNDHQESFDIIETDWSTTRTTLDVIKEPDILVDYLRHFLQLRHGLVREEDIYSKVESTIASEAEAVKFSNELSATAIQYAAIHTAGHQFWRNGDGVDRNPHRTIVQELNEQLHLRYHRALLLACCNKLSPTELLKVLLFIRSLSVRLLCCGGMRSGKTETALANAAKEVFDGKLTQAHEIISNLSPITPTDNQFTTAFATKKISDNSEARYLLIMIENHLRKKQQEGTEVNRDTHTTNLEHILPKGKIKEQDAPGWNHFTPDEKREYSLRLGNMALSLMRANSIDDQKPFGKKRSGVLAEGGFLTNSWFTGNTQENDLWTRELIDRRQQWLASLSTATWPIK